MLRPRVPALPITLPLLLLLAAGAGCRSPDFVFPAPVSPAKRYERVIPFRAAHLVASEGATWSEYDPKLRGPQIQASLKRLRELGARQVIIEAPYAWTTEQAVDRHYQLPNGTSISGNVIYYDKSGRGPSDCQRGDMGLLPFAPRGAWMTQTARQVSDPLPLPTNPEALEFSGPFRPFAHPHKLTLAFAAGWDGGDVIVTGTDESDKPQEELWVGEPGATRQGDKIFKTVTLVRWSAKVTGPAKVSISTVASKLDPAPALEVLRGVLSLVRQAQLEPVLYLHNLGVPAHPLECQPCATKDDCYDPALPNLAPSCDDSVCRTAQGDSAYLDPSRDPDAGFSHFFTQVETHAKEMAQLAAENGVALLVIGGGSPYLSGGGQATFADNSFMEDRKTALTAGWRRVITSTLDVLSRTAVDKGLPRPLLTYTAQNLFDEEHLARAGTMSPEWAMVDFWQQLDLVGIDFFLPARGSTAAGVDPTDLQVRDMVRYMETRGLESAGVGNFADLELFARNRGFSLQNQPILLFRDGAPAVRFGASEPLPLPPPGTAPDFEEQRRFLEARLLLAGQYAQHGWLGGLGLYLIQANRDPLTGLPSFGGRTKATALLGGFDSQSDYFGLLDTPSESVIETYWSSRFRDGP